MIFHYFFCHFSLVFAIFFYQTKQRKLIIIIMNIFVCCSPNEDIKPEEDSVANQICCQHLTLSERVAGALKGKNNTGEFRGRCVLYSWINVGVRGSHRPI